MLPFLQKYRIIILPRNNKKKLSMQFGCERRYCLKNTAKITISTNECCNASSEKVRCIKFVKSSACNHDNICVRHGNDSPVRLEGKSFQKFIRIIAWVLQESLPKLFKNIVSLSLFCWRDDDSVYKPITDMYQYQLIYQLLADNRFCWY